MLPKLTAGSINQILNGDNVSGAVMQILSCKKISDTDNRYRLLITDGVTGFPFFILNTPLNSLVTNKELEKFTIIRVDNYFCDQSHHDRKVIILLHLTILTSGANIVSVSKEDVSVMLGSPKTSSVPSSNTTNGTDALNTTECSQRVIMSPKLTSGSINRILSGEEVSGAVIQILSYEKIFEAGNDHYRLLISDGITSCPFAMLDTQLNILVTNKELEKFTIVRVDKCVCNQVQPDQKVINLLNLTVLTPGADVGIHLDNPRNASSASTVTSSGAGNFNNISSKATFSTNTEPKAIPTNGTNASNNSQSKPTFAVDVGTKALTTNKMNTCNKSNSKLAFSVNVKTKLTSGSINRILSGKKVSGAVMQILDCRKILSNDNVTDRYSLFISDGLTSYQFTMLCAQLNILVTNKELEKFTIVRLDKCVCQQVRPDRKVIILLNLTVLTPGADVGIKLGNPKNAISESTVTSNRAVSVKTKLSSGSINHILSGKKVSGAIMQILGCKKILVTGNDRYRLLISDGLTHYPFVMLGTYLNILVTNKELENFTIVRVDKCACFRVKPDRKDIVLLNLTVLIPGADACRKLGNSKIESSTSTVISNGSDNSNNTTSKVSFSTNTELESLHTNETDASNNNTSKSTSVDTGTKALPTNRMDTSENISDISNPTILNSDANEKLDNPEDMSSISTNSTTINTPYVCSTELTDLIMSLLQR